MKKLIIILLLPITVFSQQLNPDENGYYDVLEFEGLTKTQIYERASEWINSNYSSIYDFIQANTSDEIVVRGNFSVSNENYVHNFEHTLILTFEAQSIRVEFLLNSLYNERAKKMESIRYGYLSRNKKKLFQRLVSISQAVARETIIEQSIQSGATREEAESFFLSVEPQVRSQLPKSMKDIDYEEFFKYYDLIRGEVGNIFLSLANHVKGQ